MDSKEKANHFRIYSNDMIENMKLYLNNEKKFITFPKFVFLCGAAYEEGEYPKTNRGIVDKYIKANNENIFIVLSENIWEENFEEKIDLLTFEEFLAEVSDAIILFAESPGSFCELGAFSSAEKIFNEKLMIVIDKKYKNQKSFLLTGPTKKAEKDGAKIIYAPLDGSGLLSSDELRNNIDNKTFEFSSKRATINKRRPNENAEKVFVNTFILELLELIIILQPVSRNDLLNVYRRVKDFSGFKLVKSNGSNFFNEIKIEYIIKLLDVVELIEYNEEIITINVDFYKNYQALMFNHTKILKNKERNRLICRKYRYGVM